MAMPYASNIAISAETEAQTEKETETELVVPTPESEEPGETVVTEPPTEPATEPTAPSTEPGTEPATEPGETVVTEAPTEPGTETEAPATEPATETPATEPATETEAPATEPATETETPATEPTTETETETETETPATEPQTEAPTTEPETEKEVVSDGGLGELAIAVSGYPVSSLTAAEAASYRYLRKDLGLNKAAAAGVLANIYCESAFSSVAIGDGGTSLGLCQWHNERCRSLMSWCSGSGYDYRSVEGQLHYLGAELQGGYSGVLSYLQNVPNTAEGAYQAGYYFCMYFESPDSVLTRSDARGKIAASTYFPADLDKYLEEEKDKGTEELDKYLIELMKIRDEEVRTGTAVYDVMYEPAKC